MRIFHAGRNPAHRARDRALVAAGAEVVYVVPRTWSEPGAEDQLSPETFPVLEVDVARPGDVNRHAYTNPHHLAQLATEHRVDVLDLFEEPFSRAAAQLLPLLPPDLPVVMYSAQNLDKRWPPPFAGYERRSFARVQGFYPCSRQAASVLRAHGYAGVIEPIPLGYDPALYRPGRQSGGDSPLRLLLVGRMVEEKGVLDAVQVLPGLRRRSGRDVALTLAGSGPATEGALQMAARLAVGDCIEHRPWLAGEDLAELYRQSHVVLTPSRSTATWVEQFGRMVVEGQASGCVVVGYASGSLPEVGGAAAVLVEEGHTPALEDALVHLATHPDDWAERSAAGIAGVADKTWAAVAAAQMDLYRRALSEPSRPVNPASPARRRAGAIAEFGPPAAALGQTRMFALPVLRAPTAPNRWLGTAFDAASELAAAAKRMGARR